MNKYAIVVAGGKGLRMESKVPKQFLLLVEKPILMHTLEAFQKAIEGIAIVLVLPSDQIETWKLLVKKHSFNVDHRIVAGGKDRFNSVKNGLTEIPEDSLVAIHDGVRPLISKDVIVRSFEGAAVYGNAIVSVALKESLREVDQEGNKSVDRGAFRLIQTPQTFKSSLIKKAFSNASHSEFTDDAGVLENAGVKIHLIEGDYKNIKITTREDLLFAEATFCDTKKAFSD